MAASIEGNLRTTVQVILRHQITHSKAMSITTTPEVEFEDVVFATLPSERFRARICTRNNGTLIWLECKRTKKQWQAIIDKIGQCGSHNLPEDFVVNSLQVSV
jgi:hypothetical protein